MAIVSLAAIMLKFRKLTGTSNSLQITDADIKDYINSFYSYDFPAQFRSLKLKDKYTFNTIQGIDTYPFNSEQYTTVEMPCYCMKREIKLFQDPWNFYGVNFNWQQQQNFAFANTATGSGPYTGQLSAIPLIRSVNNDPAASPTSNAVPGSGGNVTSGVITGATQANPCVITSVAHGLFSGAIIKISAVVGMTQLNGNTFIVSVINANSFSINIDSTGYTAYVSGGSWTTQAAYPSQGYSGYQTGRVQNILITANTATGTLNVTDDGNGNLIGDISVAAGTNTINYFTGAVSVKFSSAPLAGNAIQIQYNPVQPNIPLSILFFQNQFTLRPVPDRGYTVELIAYRQPSQALLTNQNTPNAGTPELSEWWECIAFGAAKKFYEDRLDPDGIALMDKSLRERYDVAYTRTYAQLGKQRIGTIYADQLTGNYGGNMAFGNNGSV